MKQLLEPVFKWVLNLVSFALNRTIYLPANVLVAVLYFFLCSALLYRLAGGISLLFFGRKTKNQKTQREGLRTTLICSTFFVAGILLEMVF